MQQTTFWFRQEMRYKLNVYTAIKIKKLHTLTQRQGPPFSFPCRDSGPPHVRFKGQWPKITKKDERSLQTSSILETQREEAVSLGRGRIQTKTKQARTVCAYFCAHRNVCRLLRFYHLVITDIIGKAYLFVFVCNREDNFYCGGFIGGWTPLSLCE